MQDLRRFTDSFGIGDKRSALRAGWDRTFAAVSTTPIAEMAVNQPRNRQGEWSKGGMSVAAAPASPGAAMAKGQAEFKAAGGVTGRVDETNVEGVLSAHTKTQELLAKHRPFGPDTGDEYTGRAITSAKYGKTVYAARGPKGHIAGAISTRETVTQIKIDYLGSTGLMKGTGSTLTAMVMRTAAKQGRGLVLEADDGAIPFWRKMGFKVEQVGPYTTSMTMGADEVKAAVGG